MPFPTHWLGWLAGALWPRPGTAPSDAQVRRLSDLCRMLLSERGEASGLVLVREAVAQYRSLDAEARRQFFARLAADFSSDARAITVAAQRYGAEPTEWNLVHLQHAVEPARREIFRRLNTAPGGTAALVAMRSAVLRELPANPEFAGIDADLLDLFGSWFNRGFLELRRIDWRSPAVVLEKIIEYEAVHEIRGWDDLRRRLERDRCCFGFFHPLLPDEPLVFVEVALVRGMASRIAPLITGEKVEDPSKATCAMFYSITSCHEGLRGVAFGSFLIKQVALELGRQYPRLRTYATLSPIPGFRRWLAASCKDVAAAVDQPGWRERPTDSERLRKMLVPLCAWYLTRVKRGAEPWDAVARFHIGNGAELRRINWLADESENALRQSAGLMVNYEYRLDHLERNHELYARERGVLASREVAKLAERSLLAKKRTARPNAEGIQTG